MKKYWKFNKKYHNLKNWRRSSKAYLFKINYLWRQINVH